MENANEKLATITEDLKKIIIDARQNPTKCVDLLNRMSQSEPEVMREFDAVDDFYQILKSSHVNMDIKIRVTKCIADITKVESQRNIFTNSDVIVVLVSVISSGIQPAISNMEYVVQVCRALGNILYQNKEARDELISFNGDEKILNLLNVTKTELRDAAKNLPDVLPGTENIFSQFITVRCGLISNFLVGGEEASRRAMNLQIMDKLECRIDECVSKNDEDSSDADNEMDNCEDLLLNLLPPLSILTENYPEMNFSNQLIRNLVKILEKAKDPDIAEICLDLLHYQADSETKDDVKLLLAKEGLCEIIYGLLEKYKNLANTSEARALMKLACEVVVLILTGDDSMNYLYGTKLIQYVEDWLDAEDIDLLTTGVLALGNFARTDRHCIEMVEKNIVTKLLKILAQNNGTENDMRLQHALLSTLRNLVIPKRNKPAIIEAGLVDTILPMLSIHQSPVVFKLLGTLRMTVDGQYKLALTLLENAQLIKQLVVWSNSSDYAGVTGESLRLMAWLIKHAYFVIRDNGNSGGRDVASSKAAGTRNSSPDIEMISVDGEEVQQQKDNPKQTLPIAQRSKNSLIKFVSIDGALKCMVNMLTSQHLVMQNESLIALSIITAVIGFDVRSTTSNVSPVTSTDTSEVMFVNNPVDEPITISSSTDTDCIFVSSTKPKEIIDATGASSSNTEPVIVSHPNANVNIPNVNIITVHSSDSDENSQLGSEIIPLDDANSPRGDSNSPRGLTFSPAGGDSSSQLDAENIPLDTTVSTAGDSISQRGDTKSTTGDHSNSSSGNTISPPAEDSSCLRINPISQIADPNSLRGDVNMASGSIEGLSVEFENLSFPSRSQITETPPNPFKLDELFIECKLDIQLSEFIKKSSDSMTKEIVENIQILISLLRRSELLTEQLAKCNIDDLLQSIPKLKEYCTI